MLRIHRYFCLAFQDQIDDAKAFYPITHGIDNIETFTWENAPRIISQEELQRCESGYLHASMGFSKAMTGIRHVGDMMTLVSTHYQRPFYMIDREGHEQLFM